MNGRLLISRLLATLRARRLDRELDDEIRAHLELAERDALAAGLSPAEARRRARLHFGTIEALKDEHRDRRTIQPLEIFFKDVRYALRGIVREPGFAAIVVAVLALGIGANTAMFSLVDGVLLKPLPFANPERIVRVWEAPRPGVTNATQPKEFLHWKRLGSAFEAFAAEYSIAATMSGSGDPIRLPGKAVTADYFKVFGATPAVGRLFAPEEDQPGATPVLVLSHATWQTNFGRDPDILTRTIVLDGEAHQVIGVLPAGAFDRDQADFWKPLVFTPEQRQHDLHWLTVHGRLRENTTLTQARQQMDAIDAALAELRRVKNPDSAIVVEPVEKLLVGEDLEDSVLIGFGAATLVLFIACANVANLLLTRGAARRKELAVRAALGAGRGRLASQLLTESLVLCALGGLAGVAIAWLILSSAVSVLSESLPYTADVVLDVRVLGFATGIVLVVGLAIGAFPSLHTRFGSLAQSLNESGRGSSGTHARIRRVIVVGEVALSLVLICGAGLLFRSLSRLQQLESGVRIENIVTVSLDLPVNVYGTAASAAQFFESVAERVGAVPGVERAALTTHLPLRWISNGEGLRIAGAKERVNVRFKRVDHGYFDAFDIPVIAGRGITSQDRQGAPTAVVFNEALAARLAQVAGIRDPSGEFSRLPLPLALQAPPFSSLLGQTVQLTAPDYLEKSGIILDAEIVGVIRSERVGAPWRSDPPVAYVPLAQVPRAAVRLILRTGEIDAARVMPAVREAIKQIAPALPLGRVATMEQIRAETFSPASRPAWIIGVFASVAALLAALGLYGVVTYAVAQQRREIGIRMALGARAGGIVSHVLGGALSVVGLGLVLGLVGSFALTRMMKSMLYQISPLDPLALAFACASMMVIALVAGFVPASRAARVDPVSVLREEG